MELNDMELVCNKCWRIIDIGGLIQAGNHCCGLDCDGIFMARPQEVFEISAQAIG